MKITYDAEGDVLAIELRDLEKYPPPHGADISPGIIGLKNDKGELVGIEILDAHKRVDGDPATVSLQVLTDENIQGPAEPAEAGAART